MWIVTGILVALADIAKELCAGICGLSCMVLYLSVKRNWQVAQLISASMALISGSIAVTMMIVERAQ